MRPADSVSVGRIILLDMTKIISDSSLSFKSPIGEISLHARGEKIVLIEIGSLANPGNRTKSDGAVASRGKAKVLSQAKNELLDYLDGKSKALSFAVDYQGTEFQEAVWKVIGKIKFGQTLSYGEIAQKIGNPAAVRAVGGAVGANPVPIRIGCHRVLGSSGTITGYSGGDGIETKRKLLALENIEVKN